MLESLQEVYAALDPGMRLLVEYKLFEPAFYHKGSQRLGPQHCCVKNWDRKQLFLLIPAIMPKA